MEQWLQENLAKCFDFPIPDEMIASLLAIKNEYQLDQHLDSLLDMQDPQHRTFVIDFKNRINPKHTPGNDRRKPTVSVPISRSEADKKKSKSPEVKPGAATTTGTKKKQKFVSLYNQDGEMREFSLLKGRHHCDCQATKHKLVNNCLKCGRIVCEQEGSGPCLFCGNLVCSEEEFKLIEMASRKGENLKKSLLEQKRPKGWEEALATRNRLLEYDRNSEKRTTVIDDESDYFKTNSVWLSDSERKKLKDLETDMHEKVHQRRSQRSFALDITGRQLIEEPVVAVDVNDKILQQIANSCATTKHTKLVYENPTEAMDPNLDTFTPIFNYSSHCFESTKTHDGVFNKVQDKEFLEMSDMKNCLSMHQPWASLLIAGIKKHEGRSWYTAHRGRLWIASTAKPVNVDEAKSMQNFYRKLYDDDKIEFPPQYPAGCLLGCVLVQDCLPQEEYRQKYPNGESESPFVMICTDAQELPIRFPISGMHKIYKLDPKIHHAAQQSLRRIAKIKAGE